MDNWIAFGPDSSPMQAYSAPHLLAMAVILIMCIGLVLFCNCFRLAKQKKYFRYAFVVFIALQQASIYAWYILSGEWSVEKSLPLQLCDLSLILSMVVLLTKQQWLMELLYYWGIGGATQAVLTPAIGAFTFPHIVFYQFFLSHCIILMVCFYMIFVKKFKPSPVSVWRTFIITNLYALIIYPINLLTGGNYLFLARKPIEGTLLDLLGPWPWYLLWLEFVALLLFFLLYLPFASGRDKENRPGISL